MSKTVTIKPDDLVMPGDRIVELQDVNGKVIIGPGLRRSEDDPKTISVTRAGHLRHKNPNVYWIEGRQKRYVPRKNDLVLGTVIKKGGDSLKVDIGANELASLSTLAFEGATKKQKPDVQVGDVIYAKVLTAHKEMEPDLVCIDSYGKAGRLGLLPTDGFVMNISLALVYRLLNLENPLLSVLGKKFAYEIVIGVNGKVWMNAKQTQDILKLVCALQTAETVGDAHIIQLCRQL